MFRKVWPRLGMVIAMAGAAGLASAETRAVIVGIDAYSDIRELKGAVNDARDLDGVLRRRGVTDITLLTDAEASRANLSRALDDLVKRAEPGDTIIISFAGHGTSERWGRRHPADAREGDSYEVFLLQGYVPPDMDGKAPPGRRQAIGERILGREMRTWLTALDAKSAHTLFIADTCHAGGLTRQVVLGAPELSYRGGPPFPTAADGEDPLLPTLAKLPPDPSSEFDHLKAMPNVTFLAAVDSKSLAPEVEIPPGSNTRRGALSFAAARALEGEADANHDGHTTRQELFQYVRSDVRQISQNRQIPVLQPIADTGPDSVVFDSVAGTAHSAAADSVSRTVRFFADGEAPSVASSGRTGDLAIEMASSREEADYIWQVATGRIISSVGDHITTVSSPDQLAGVAEREVARRRLVDISRPRPVELSLRGSDRLYERGDIVEIEADLSAKTDQHYVVFNIAGDGTVQYLYPAKADRQTLQPGPSRFDEIQASPPFGADLVVLVVAPQPLDALANRIQSLDGTKAPLDAVAAIVSTLTDGTRLGVQGLFTAEKK